MNILFMYSFCNIRKLSTDFYIFIHVKYGLMIKTQISDRYIIKILENKLSETLD